MLEVRASRSSLGFFERRRPFDFQPALDAGSAAGGVTLSDYPNVSKVTGALISLKMATLMELQTFYSVEDAYNMLEIAIVDAHNTRLLREAAERQK